MEKGNAVMFDEKGMLLIDKKLEKISVRGNTSADLPKKPFRIEFAEEIGLCGMEPAREWNLIANYKDETHIRNKLMLDWADELGEGYNVEGEYLELYVNGEYQGLYLLTETVTVGENRLELEADNSIFAEMELYYRAPEEKNYIVTERSHYWVIHSEEKLSEEKLADITKWFNEVESALYSENGTGNNTGKALEEMLDFDSSLGNTKLEIFRNPRNLVVAIPNTKGIECVTQNKWLAPMYQNPLFKEMLVNKFQTEIRPKIKQLLEWQIDEYISKIERSVLLDSVRWEKNLVETKEGESIP